MAPLNLPPPALTLEESKSLEQEMLTGSAAKTFKQTSFKGSELEHFLKTCNAPFKGTKTAVEIGNALLEHRLLHEVSDEDEFALSKTYRLISQESPQVNAVHSSQSLLIDQALFHGKIWWKTTHFFGLMTKYLPVYGILSSDKITLLKCRSAACAPLAEFSVKDMLDMRECVDCKPDVYCFDITTKSQTHVILCADHSKRQEGWMSNLVQLGVPFIKTEDVANDDIAKIGSLFELSARRLNSKEIVDFSQFKGKVCLVVNVSSLCGLTPQYAELQTLYEKYQDKGLRIIGFPVNQFHNQEPGTEEEIANFAKTKYNITFDMLEKTHCNGKDAHPVFRFVKNHLGGVLGSSVKWNFTKFLCDRNGNPVKRYAPTTKPLSFEEDIVALLDAN